MNAVPPPKAISSSAPTKSFRGAKLGMDMPAWRASAPWRRDAACEPTEQDVVVCRSADQPLGPRHRARELTSTFRAGVLTSISFVTSIDGFSAAMAELRHSYGDPLQIRRDDIALANGQRMPHVGVRWRRGATTVRLSDPNPNLLVKVDIASRSAT